MRTKEERRFPGVMEQSGEKEAREEVKGKNNWFATWREGTEDRG